MGGGTVHRCIMGMFLHGDSWCKGCTRAVEKGRENLRELDFPSEVR